MPEGVSESSSASKWATTPAGVQPEAPGYFLQSPAAAFQQVLHHGLPVGVVCAGQALAQQVLPTPWGGMRAFGQDQQKWPAGCPARAIPNRALMARSRG